MPTMAGDDQLPTVKHLYQNHAMDAVRWNYFKPRANDIVVATTYHELRLYDTAASRELTPECRSWLEQGGRY